MPSSGGKTTNETSNDHTDVEEDGEDGVSGGETGQEGKGDQKEGSGEKPVKVTCRQPKSIKETHGHRRPA